MLIRNLSQRISHLPSPHTQNTQEPDETKSWITYEIAFYVIRFVVVDNTLLYIHKLLSVKEFLSQL